MRERYTASNATRPRAVSPSPFLPSAKSRRLVALAIGAIRRWLKIVSKWHDAEEDAGSERVKHCADAR
jgi:hypothetical protein